MKYVNANLFILGSGDLEEELKEFYSNQITITEEIQKFISTEIKISIRELVGALNRILSFSRIYNKVPSLSEIKIVLKDLLTLLDQAFQEHLPLLLREVNVDLDVSREQTLQMEVLLH